MHKIENAVDILGEHITRVTTVAEWAELMGYSSADYFSKKVKTHYGCSPKEIYIQQKIKKIKECLRTSPDDIYYCIARELGFANDTALYKFVNRHTGMCIGSLKRESEKGV
ncbi:MAG: AraC family transcriptional regulator [Balneola sp.]|nr:MAG: AraC family transcriptional regulator [Balneola sp.]